MTPHELKTWLEPYVTKLDRIADDITEIRVTQGSQATDLAHHIRRTDLLEDRVEQLAVSIEPVKAHVQQVRGVGIFLGVVLTVIGIAAALLKLV